MGYVKMKRNNYETKVNLIQNNSDDEEGALIEADDNAQKDVVEDNYDGTVKEMKKDHNNNKKWRIQTCKNWMLAFLLILIALVIILAVVYRSEIRMFALGLANKQVGAALNEMKKEVNKLNEQNKQLKNKINRLESGEKYEGASAPDKTDCTVSVIFGVIVGVTVGFIIGVVMMKLCGQSQMREMMNEKLPEPQGTVPITSQIREMMSEKSPEPQGTRTTRDMQVFG